MIPQRRQLQNIHQEKLQLKINFPLNTEEWISGQKCLQEQVYGQAMWMLPNDSRYGSWPLSGEIDVFEGRGRTPDMVFGTLHYGAQWPNNINTSDVFNMVQDGKKKTGIADWHVYSVVWDAEIIKIYCDGKCYFKCTYGEWYSGSDRGNAYAPFDQRFYLILNLAAGGTFDSGYVPDVVLHQGFMKVDYDKGMIRKY